MTTFKNKQIGFGVCVWCLIGAACTDSSPETGADGGDPPDGETATDSSDQEIACDGTEPFCNKNELVTCVDGKQTSTACEEMTFCNAGACQAVDISFPEDAAFHNYRTEWWYYTGHLTDGTGKWGFEVTIFQYNMTILKGYMCHVGITDEIAAEHYHRDQFVVVPAKWSKSPIEFVVGACRFELGGDGNDHIVATIPKGQEKDGLASPWKLDLTLTPTKKPVFHGGDGLIPMADGGGKSWYYSYTRLAAEGTLETPGGAKDVTGQGWSDHQWGPFDVINQFKGWDWWSMQLDDDWEIMLFQFFNWDGELVTQAGTIVDPEGNQTELEGLEDFTITSLREWESPHTDGIYPMDWDVTISEMNWNLQVRTYIDDQEMYNSAQNYWEGNTHISGTRGSEPVSGVGYTELTGYASDLLDPQ